MSRETGQPPPDPGAPSRPSGPPPPPPDDHLEPRPLPTTRINRAVVAVVGIAAILVLWAGVWAFGRAAERKKLLRTERPGSTRSAALDERQLDRLERQAARPGPPARRAPTPAEPGRRPSIFSPSHPEPRPPRAPARSSPPEKTRRELLTEAAYEAPRILPDFAKPALYDFQTGSSTRSAAPASTPVDRFRSSSLGAPGPPGWRLLPASTPPSAPLHPTDPTADPNLLAYKGSFLARAAADRPPAALATIVQVPISPYTLHQGWLLPAVLVTGLNSDLPGQVTALLRAPVYDSATGRHELLPAGSRLVGTYDHRVARGQRRILIAWQRLIFPDGRWLDLGALPGVDHTGLTGLRDRVDNHFLRTFGSALLVSALSAGAQLSQPQESQSFGEAASTRQVLAAALGQEIDRAANQILRRNLAVQPTLRIRPGYAFYVQLTADLVLPGAWQPTP